MAGASLKATDFKYHGPPYSLTGLLWSAWLCVPPSVRLVAYQALWRFSDKRGRTSSPYVRRLVPFNVYAKRGLGITAQEAFATQFVAENTTIPVPRMLDVIKLPSRDDHFLLMTGVKGREYGPTKVILDTMPERQRAVFTETLRVWFEQLRQLSPPDDQVVSGFMGTGVTSDRIAHYGTVGPFGSVDEFHAQSFCQPWKPYDDALRTALETRAERPYRICFTHGDINPRNILVDDALRPCALIDWQCAGWMPEYWEYTRTLYIHERYLGWKQVFTEIFPNYEAELAVERAIWARYTP